jgi:phage gp29-like protein
MTETYSLTDQYGVPLPKKPETRPVAEPTMTGVRSIWNEPVASGLTPERLARVLRQSAEPGGDTREYLTLAEEIEEREPHYRAVITTRKLALRAIPPVIEAASTDKVDVDIADAVRKLVATPAFRSSIVDLCDGLSKGYSVVEMLWTTSATRWSIGGFAWRDPRMFQFDRITGMHLRLREDGNIDGVPLQPAKFVVHVPKLKSGQPIRGGLARVAMWMFMLKSFSLKDWMNFLDVYGIPWRIGKWHPGASREDKSALLRAVANIASDGAAIIPEAMIIELLETRGSKATDAFEKLCKYLDMLMSKLVLGQTTTTDAVSGGHAVSKEHQEIRRELVAADADELSATIQRDMIEPFVFYNFGMPKNGMPLFTLPVIEPEDIKATMEVLTEFVDRGGRVSEAEVRDRIGFSDPDADEIVLRPLSAGRAAAEQPPAAKAINRMRCPGCGGVHGVALASQQALTDIDRMAAEACGDWQEVLPPVVDPLLALARECGSFEELLERLPQAVRKMDSSALASQLAKATAIARGLGDVGEG